MSTQLPRIALITGATRGIGRAILDAFVAEGIYVIGTATTTSGAAAISEICKDRGCGELLRVTDPESVASLQTRLHEAGYSIDILVNNAGITRDNLLIRMSDHEWDEVIATNLTAVFRLSRTFLRDMLKKRCGRILTIGSVVGSSGNFGQSNYAATKAGLLGFSKSLAREVGSRGITVNVVAPGFIETDMTAALSEAQRNKLLKEIPANRLGKAEEVAAVALFLVSKAAGYITGETIHVNGGMLMN